MTNDQLLAECVKAAREASLAATGSEMGLNLSAVVARAIIALVRPHVLAEAAACCEERARVWAERQETAPNDAHRGLCDDRKWEARVHAERILALATPSKAQAETKENA